MAEPEQPAEAESQPEPATETKTTPEADHKPEPKTKLGLKARWHNLSKRNKIIVGAAGGLLAVLLLTLATPLRYIVVGSFHQGTLTATVVDDSTGDPVPDAQVGIGKVSATTDKSGHVVLKDLKLGHANVTINKHAYDTKTIPVTVFWRPVKLGTVKIHSNGVLIKFSVSDWVSTKPVTAAKVTIGNSSAVTDASGEASVSIEPQAVAGAKAAVMADGYNLQAVTVAGAEAPNAVKLVPAGSVYYFSNRSGRIDLYSAKLDGSGQTVVLKGTGSEDSATGLLPSINDPDTMAIVSSRIGKRATNGTLEHDLFMYSGGKFAQIDSGVDFEDFRAWIGDNLVYIVTDKNGNVVIKSYNAKTKTAKKLTTITKPDGEDSYTYVQGLSVASDKLYYTVTSNDESQIGFYSIGLTGGSKQLDTSYVSQAYRQSKPALSVGLSDNNNPNLIWKSLNFATGGFTQLAGEPASESNRGYADSPDKTHSVYVETRDGKSQLYLTDGEGKNDTAITTSGVVNQFVNWYNNRYVVYSTNDKGSVLHIVAITGGTEQKVADFFQGNGKTYGGGYNPAYE